MSHAAQVGDLTDSCESGLAGAGGMLPGSKSSGTFWFCVGSWRLIVDGLEATV